jgi:hypothetical protein
MLTPGRADASSADVTLPEMVLSWARAACSDKMEAKTISKIFFIVFRLVLKRLVHEQNCPNGLRGKVSITVRYQYTPIA